MSEIQPALSIEEWAAREVARGSEFSGHGITAAVDPFLGFTVDNMIPETQSSHDTPAHVAVIIALANAALPDDDPRKITRQIPSNLRAVADFLNALALSGTDGAALETQLERVLAGDALRKHADALESYLPPE